VGSISFLNYADRLYQLPLSIIGVSLSSILLPLLSEAWRQGRSKKATYVQHQALCLSGLLAIPVTLFLITLALPVVALLFGDSRLNPQDLNQVAVAVWGYSSGIPAYILIKVMNTRFFAKNKTTIPLIGSCISVVVDVAVSLMLLQQWKHLGLALGLSAAAWVNVLFLALVTYKEQKGWMYGDQLLAFWGKVLLASAPAALIWSSHGWLAPGFIYWHWIQRFLGLLALGVLGMMMFALGLWMQNVLNRETWNQLALQEGDVEDHNPTPSA
jgi:putative peptidoglycan lipid II flippase